MDNQESFWQEKAGGMTKKASSREIWRHNGGGQGRDLEKERRKGMKNLTFYNIAKACGGRLYHYCPEQEQEVEGVVLDSRLVQKGYLFIATKGERVDGHCFISQVCEKGAAGIVCEKLPEECEIPCILVEDSFQALKDIAEFYRQQLSIKIVGVTGSVGKTSTKEAIAAVLSTRYQVGKTEGNFNNEIGLPLTILKIRDHHQVAVVEMGISDFGEMHRLSKIARPDICVLTNIGQCHLENLKSREGILQAKTEIFDFMQEDGLVCLNGDDDMLKTVTQVKGREPIAFGLSASHRIYASSVENRGLFGSRIKVHVENREFLMDIPLPGEHMVYNALAAVCVGRLMGIGEEDIVKGMESLQPVGGRSHVIRLENRVIIDDCYNANPVSVCAALDLLSTALTRRVAVLGDMFELGEEEQQMHETVGSYAMEGKTDLLICIGTLAKAMYTAACQRAEEKQAQETGKDVVAAEKGYSLENIYYFKEKEEFLKQSEDILQPGDTVLVKASHGMAFGEIVKALEGKAET